MTDLLPITNIINSFYFFGDMQSNFDACFASFDAQMWLVLNVSLSSEHIGLRKWDFEKIKEPYTPHEFTLFIQYPTYLSSTKIIPIFFSIYFRQHRVVSFLPGSRHCKIVAKNSTRA